MVGYAKGMKGFFRKRKQMAFAATISLLVMAGCGLESSENYISPPTTRVEESGSYAFQHSAARAADEGLYGYEILYRMYTSSVSMQTDSATIEGYIGSYPTMTFSKMESLGYKRITPEIFNQDILLIAADYPAFASSDLIVSLNFNASADKSIVKLLVIDDVDASSNSEQLAYRGVASQSQANRGKGFEDIRIGDADVAGNETAASECFLQAYVFSVGLNDDFTKYYSIPGKLGSNVILTIAK